MIASLNFVGNGPDDLGAGCQPFLVVYTSQAEHYRALDEANVANQLDQGTASASLADIRDIRDKEKVKLPRDLNQVSLTLRRFAILAHTLFQGPGDSNPFVKSMWLLGNKFHERLPHYLGHHQGLAGTPWWDVYASHVLRHVQINVFEYLQALQVSGGVGADMDAPEPPSFHELLRDLQRGCFHMSSSWLPLPAAVTADASTAFRGEANTVGTRTTRASTAASTTSGLTASTGGGRASSGASGATAPQGTYVANPARDPEFDTLQLRPQMRDLLRAHPPPANDAGNAFCVSWWGRGGCYTNCGRASTHRPFANPGNARLLAHAAAKLDNSVNWEWFVATERGQADITPTVGTLPHKAARLLEHLRKRGAGVPLHTGPWSEEQLQRAAARGSHQSAKGEVEFVCTEMVEFCDQGFWVVLPLEVALTLPNLRLSPLGVVPQRNRRPRLIVDYTYSGVNDDTARLAPPEAMQFGRALRRFLTKLVNANPAYGPVFLAKIDIADGFYRISLRPHDIPRLGVILPTDGGAPLVALPLTLPMGWVESPPYFTSVTETACDLLNGALRRGAQLPPHHLESLAATPPADVPPTIGGDAPRLAREGSTVQRTPPITYGDVYVDDFILAAQTKRHRRRVMRAALHAIDHVLRPLAPSDRGSRKEPVSIKKLRQGDASWATQKTILGWDLDTVAGTLNLPPHRLARLYTLLDAFPPTRKRVPLPAWHQLLGELRSMAAALPGARGLFSTLQDALRHGDRHRVRLSRRIFDSLADFRAIADSLRTLVTSDNRHGTVSISDLELAGTMAHKHVLTQATSVAERPIWLAGDNRASLAWATKGSATASTARAYLLRLNALHQRYHRYVPQHDYIAGTANVMADDASHLVEVAPPRARDALCSDWGVVTATLRSGQSAHRLTSASSAVRAWHRFCTTHGIHPALDDIHGDPVPVLMLFAQQYRAGRIAPSDRPVRSRTVEDAVRQVAQAFTRVGADDPRLNSFGAVDFRLQSLFAAWKRIDTPPTRVKPMPFSVLRHAHMHAMAHPPGSRASASGDCLLLAYYFLLRPGEYSGIPRTEADDLFRLQDIGVSIGHRRLAPSPVRSPTSTPLLSLPSRSPLRRTVCVETIGHGRSGHPTNCPVHALIRRITQLRAAGATPTTPLNAYRTPGDVWRFVLAAHITTLIRHAVSFLPDLVAADFSARCTRAGGAMALLCAGIGSDRLRLIGRWRSDEVYRYLHVQAQPIMAGVATAMLRGGDFRLNLPPFPPGAPPGGPPFPALLAPMANEVQPP
ncbi:hypothetical protein MHU86_6630 [Fragilaria crotonensis]|nr:hypothetical protein MHU86_6630 [Fragilaria crotonensis]